LPRLIGEAGGASITLRLVVFAILLVSVTAVLIGTLSYTRARRALEHEARSRLALLARDVAEHLRRELEDRVVEITSWAHLEVMRAVLYHDVDKELAQFLQHAVGARQTYRGIACVSVDGEVVASAGDTASGFLPRSAPPARTRISILSPAAGSGERSLRLEASVSNPDQPGKTIATLAVLLDRRRLLDTIEASARLARAGPLVTVRSSAGDVVLATGDGAPPEHHGSPQAARARMLEGLAAVAPLPSADGPDLEVLVAEPARVALSAVLALRATLLKVGILVLIVGSVLGVAVAWRISSPIGRLTETVRRITARGELDGEVELPHAAGEVGVLAAAFRTMLESLKAAQAEALVQSRRAFLGEVAANIAHEVRTPLSVLKTSAQLLARQELPPVEQQALAKNVTAEVDRLNGVVTSLVDLARPRPVRYQSEPLAEILARAVAFFRPQAARLGVEIAQAPADTSLRVRGNADELHQVLLNVVHNALQAMGGPGLLSVRCYRDDGWGVVEVEDSGPGFSPEALAGAFSPFCSTKPQGTGLGLAISKRIIEEHGGTIGVENSATGGACVRIRLAHRDEST
jgi:signal transduction histidine kinase